MGNMPNNPPVPRWDTTLFDDPASRWDSTQYPTVRLALVWRGLIKETRNDEESKSEWASPAPEYERDGS
jgi:hypothetical protein